MNRAARSAAGAARRPPGRRACTDAERRAARGARRAAARRWAADADRDALGPARVGGGARGVRRRRRRGERGERRPRDRPGWSLAGAAFVLALAELGPWPLLRRLTFARATQNVVSEPPPGGASRRR